MFHEPDAQRRKNHLNDTPASADGLYEVRITGADLQGHLRVVKQ